MMGIAFGSTHPTVVAFRDGEAQRIFRQAPLRGHPRTGTRGARGRRGAVVVRRPAAFGATAALRLPARMRWRAALLGRAQGPVARPGRQTPGGVRGGPSLRL